MGADLHLLFSLVPLRRRLPAGVETSLVLILSHGSFSEPPARVVSSPRWLVALLIWLPAPGSLHPRSL